MLDFIRPYHTMKHGQAVIQTDYIYERSNDLMVRGGKFYAVWDERRKVWTTSEFDLLTLIDSELFEYANTKLPEDLRDDAVICYHTNYRSRSFEALKKFISIHPDSFVTLDFKMLFTNDIPRKEDYATKTAKYALVKGECKAYDKLIGTLYDPMNRKKIEWAIGAAISGKTIDIQKFIVIYGPPGSGKSTVLDIIAGLFEGYHIEFRSEELSKASSFAMEMFKSNPLVAIDHEGDFSRIQNNTLINSIVAHNTIEINEKFKSKYSIQLRTLLFIGTNKPVNITDAKSGLLRRLLIVTPTEHKIPREEYAQLVQAVKFEYGAIAYHCMEVYNELGPGYYDNYVPEDMVKITNVFYNFILDNYNFFADDIDGIRLVHAWARYKNYCDDAQIRYPMQKMTFKDELKNYFDSFQDRGRDGAWNVYYGFKSELFSSSYDVNGASSNGTWITLDSTTSLFDKIFANCPAQYATPDGTPMRKWSNNETILDDLNTKNVHYVQPPKELIVIDFDLKDEYGDKSLARNIEAASEWPPTYAELSQSGNGIHLHYYYTGDVESLSRLIDESIEVKVFIGNASLRRKLTLCNTLGIGTISSGLPVKGVKKSMVSDNTIKNEKHLRALISKSLRKENLGFTKPEIDFIHFLLEKAYNSGMSYDVSDMRNAIEVFASGSTNQAEYCYKTVDSMKFKSEAFEASDPPEELEPVPEEGDEEPMYPDDPKEDLDAKNQATRGGDIVIIFDIESYPNLLLLCWKRKGIKDDVVTVFNPTPEQLSEFFKFKVAGFNNRKYDNHVLYARMIGYSVEECNDLSQRIVDREKDDDSCMFGQAYNLSYTDVYDFLSSGNKMSLKKWEIKLGIHHQEMEFPWDQPIPRDKWDLVAEYCKNDVIATEAVWDANMADWTAREILAAISGLTVNNSTNQHTTRIIFGTDTNPQAQFNYPDLSEIFPGYRFSNFGIPLEEYTPGVKIVKGKSIYLGVDPGEGGRVYASPGIHYNVALLDVASMHPSSIIALCLFGSIYTGRFEELVQIRILIKHGEYDKASKLLDGALAPYLTNEADAKALANALKTAINSVYGLTFKRGSKFYDERNLENIVAKYGALFMVTLEREVQNRGYSVAHVKTDSIKIPNADTSIIEFCMTFAKQYGFTFEHEATYRKMCLVNESTYIALYEDKETCEQLYGYVPGDNKSHPLEWTATGAQFQVPFVFKKLFSKEKIDISDMAETKSVTTAMYLDNNEDLPDVSGYEKELDKLLKKQKKGEPVYEQEIAELENEITKGHRYRFVGKVGSFIPVKPGYGGGILLRKNNEDKFAAVTGTKKSKITEPGEEPVWRWVESELLRVIDKTDMIDYRYYQCLIDDAIDTISKYGDFEIFRHTNAPNQILNEPEDVPFDAEPLPF